MKRYIGIALLSVMALAMVSTTPVFAEQVIDPITNLTVNRTWVIEDGSCVFQINSGKIVDNLEIFDTENDCIGAINANTRRLKLAQDCPVPDLKTGFTWVTYTNGNNFIKGKTYMVATYWKPRWNTNAFMGKEDVELKLSHFGNFKLISYREGSAGWAFSKFKYMGEN